MIDNLNSRKPLSAVTVHDGSIDAVKPKSFRRPIEGSGEAAIGGDWTTLVFLERLLEAGVDVRFADLPSIEGPTGRFMLQQMAAVAELETGMISARTKAALAAANARGQRLGGHRGGTLSGDVQARGRHEQSRLADKRAADIAPLLKTLRAKGINTPTDIARELTAQGIPTARGGSKWSAPQVTLIEARLARMS